MRRLWGVVLLSVSTGCMSGFEEFHDVSDRRTARLVAEADFPERVPATSASPPARLETLPDGRTQVRLDLSEALRLALANNVAFLRDAEGLEVQLLSLEVLRHGEWPALSEVTTHGTWTDAKSVRGVGAQTAGLGITQRLPLGGSVTAAYTHSGAQGVGPNAYSGSWSVSVRQPLLRGAGWTVNKEGLIAAERNYEYSRGTFGFRRQSLQIAVVEVYFGLLQQETSIGNFERNLENLRRQARRAQIREQFGQVTRTDVFRSQLEVTRAESALAQAREQLKLALDAFKLDLGLPPELGVVLDPAPVEYAAGNLTVDQAVTLAMQHNPDWKFAPHRLQDARRALAIAANATLPQFDLTASYTWGTASERHLFAGYDLESRTLALGADLSFPVDRYASSREYQKAVIAYRQAERDFHRVRDRLVAEVQGRFITLRQAELAMQFAERAIADAEKAARLADFNYQRGLATNQDVLDAQSGLLEARNGYQQALVSARIQQLRLLQFTGLLTTDPDGGWLR